MRVGYGAYMRCDDDQEFLYKLDLSHGQCHERKESILKAQGDCFRRTINR